MAAEEQQHQPAPLPDGDDAVSVDAMNLMIPGLVERAEV
jgi:hypothetical protein